MYTSVLLLCGLPGPLGLPGLFVPPGAEEPPEPELDAPGGVGVAVGQPFTHGVLVGVEVEVRVGVAVFVAVRVAVAVLVRVEVAVLVGVLVGVAVEVEVGVGVEPSTPRCAITLPLNWYSVLLLPLGVSTSYNPPM